MHLTLKIWSHLSSTCHKCIKNSLVLNYRYPNGKFAHVTKRCKPSVDCQNSVDSTAQTAFPPSIPCLLGCVQWLYSLRCLHMSAQLWNWIPVFNYCCKRETKYKKKKPPLFSFRNVKPLGSALIGPGVVKEAGHGYQ